MGLFSSALACAPTQIVPVWVEPAPSRVFVDGQQLEDSNLRQIELRADRGHVLQFERSGYLTEQVVLISGRWRGKAHLQPQEIFVKLIPLERRRPEVEVQLAPIEERGSD